MDSSSVFSQFLPAAITLGCGWGRGLVLELGAKPDLLSAYLLAITALQGWGLSPVVGAEALSVLSELRSL